MFPCMRRRLWNRVGKCWILTTKGDIAHVAFRGEAHGVIPQMAFIDWLALAFAAVLLAAAVSAGLLAYLTSKARTSEPKSGYAHAAATTSVNPQGGGTQSAGLRKHAKEDAAVIDLSNHQPEHAVVPDSPDDSEDLSLGSDELLDAEQTVAVADSDPSVELDLAEIDAPEISYADSDPSSPDLGLASGAESVLAQRAARIRDRRAANSDASEAAPEVSAREVSVDEVEDMASVEAPNMVSAASVWVPETRSARQRVEDSKGFQTRNPGFFEDPMGRHELRYWDGASWTEYVKESGERFVDPL